MTTLYNCSEYDHDHGIEFSMLETLVHAAQMEQDTLDGGLAEDNEIFAVRVRETLEQILANKSNAFLLSAEDGVIKGFIHFRRDLRQGIVWVETAYVLPEYRRQGIARCLMQCLQKKAAAEGAKKIRVYTAKKNLKAQATYKKYGFKAVPTHYIGFEKTIEPKASHDSQT